MASAERRQGARNHVNIFCFYINTSRGCHCKCIFCADPIRGGCQVRTRSAEKIVEEIELIKARHGHKYFYIADSNFTAAPHQVADFCDTLIRRNTRIHWEAEPNPGDLSEDLIQRMKQSGCSGLIIGVDSGSNIMLDNYQRGELIVTAWEESAKGLYGKTLTKRKS